MKKTLNCSLTISILLLILMLHSCGPRQAKYSSDCSGKPLHIEISGSRFSGLEPFKASLKVKAYQWEEGSLVFDFYARDINKESVKIDCLEDGAEIRLIQRDGTERKFRLIATPEQLQMAEVK
jgi:hypothetical protein